MAGSEAGSSTDSNEAFITFLIYCLVVVTVVLFFLFYVNRVFAQILSKLINIYTWKKYRAYFEIDAIQFSLLGGRVLFKNFRYYSRNQSIFILQGHITFRYWFLRVREEKNTETSSESSILDNSATQERREVKELPCRIKCEIKGLEWFLYNRTPVYDIVEGIINPSKRASSVLQDFACGNSEENITVNFDRDIPPADEESSLFRKMLPIQFDCDIGSITIGNNDLPTILISSFSQATGVYSAAKPSSPLDYYKSVLNMDIISPKISCRINVDYNNRDGQTEEERADLLALEYARVSTVVECSELYFNYYADVPGPVPYQSRLEIDPSEIDIGNGGPPPQYGIHLIFKQGIIHYGPWTDQQRSCMQNYFFPNPYRDLEKTSPMQHGLPRVHTELKMFIQLDKDITIRVPFRESSKNWRYTSANIGASYGARSPRPYGWIDFKSSGFYIDLSVPLVVGENGYATMVDVRCQDLELATSTNYAAMLQSQRFHIHCVLQNPLVWNQIRTWVFDLNFEKTKLYLLRDQITLMQDMIKDWTAGPSVDFVHFIPIEYIYKMIFNELEINLYVNEHNIINDPSDLDDNAIFTLSMTRLDAAIITPFGKFEPKTNNVEFSINMQKIFLSLALPTSHTASVFLPKKTQSIGSIKGFVIDGNYEYYTKVDPTHLDTLTMNIKLIKPNVQLSGLFVKHMMIVKDNYLGAFNNFLTFEEYRSRIDSSFDRVEQINAQHQAKNPENPYEVFIRLLLEDVVFKLPENLYACEDFLELYIQELQLENRATDFYQDLYVTTTPIFLTKGGPGVSALTKQKISRIHKDQQDILYIEDITIHAHRMFGPLPYTNTYVCDWKLDFGSVLGRVGPNFLVGFNSFLDSFVFNYVDRENTFPSEFQIPSFPDLTLLKVGIADLDFVVRAGGGVSQLLVKDGIRVDFNNLVNEVYNSKAYISILELVLRFMTISEKQNDSDLGSEEIPWVEVASIETALNISAYTNTPDWKESRQKQRSFIRHEDRETLRCNFVYEDDTNTIYETSSTKAASDNHLNGFYLPPLVSTILEGYNEPSLGVNPNTSPTDLPDFFPGSQNILLHEDTKAFWPVCDSPTYMDAEFDFVESHTPPRQDKADGYLDTLSLNYSGSSRAGSMLSRWDGADNDRVSSYYTNGGVDSDSSDSYYMNDSDEDESEKDTLNSQKDAHSVPPKPVSIPYYKYLKRYKMTGDSKRELTEGNLRLKPPSTMFADLSEANTETSAFYRYNSKASQQNHNSSPVSEWLRQQEPAFKDSSNMGSIDEFDESQLENTMVIECPEHIKILLTPVFFKIVQDLVQSMDSQEWSIESLLDSIQIDNVVKPLKLENLLCRSMKYMIGIPRVHLHLIQDVTLPDDFTSSREEFPYARTRYDLSDTLLSTMDIVLDDLMVNIFVKKKKVSPDVHEEMKVVDSKVLLDFSQLRVNLRFVGIGIFGISETRLKKLPLDFINYSDNEPVVLDLLYDRFHLEWLGNKKPNSLTAVFNDFSAIFLHEAVEIIFGAAASWMAFANDMKSVLAIFQKKRSKRVQYLVATISDYSARNTIGPDPAFLSRVSGVRRLGAKEVFVNDSWRLMARIRHCSRSMTQESIRRLRSSLREHETEKWNLDAVFNTVINNFSKWRFWEFEKLDSCMLLTNIFGRKPSKVTPDELDGSIIEFLRSSENCLKMRFNRVGLYIYGENEAEDNSMVIGPIQVDSETDYLDNSNADLVAEEDKTYGQSSREILDSFVNIFLCLKVHQIDIALKPTVLTFVKHLLHVNRCFGSVFDTFSADSESDTSNDQSITSSDGFDIVRLMSKLRFSAHAMLFLDQVNVTATVEHWVTQFRLDSIKFNGISHNLLVKSSHSKTKVNSLEAAHIPIFADASSSIDSLTLVLQERVMNENRKQHTQLLSFDIHGIGVNIAFDGSKTPRYKKLLEHSEPNYLNVFIKIGNVSLKIPQNLIKLYNFVEKWKTENLPNYDFLINRLIAEWESNKKNIPPSTQLERVHNHKTHLSPLGLKLQFLLKQIIFQSDVTPSLNFRYDILDFLGYIQSNCIELDSKKNGFDLSYSVQILTQNVQFVTKHKVPSQGANQTEPQFSLHQQIATFSIPAIRSEGRVQTVNDHCKLESIIIMDFIRLTLNANLIDQLLTTHTLLSSEFNDVIDVFLYSTRKIKERRTKLNVLPASSNETPKNSLLFTNKISFKGFRIAAVSHVAVILFESDVLHGYVSNFKNSVRGKVEPTAAPLTWKIFAKKFSISLNHNAGNIGDYMESTISRDDPSMLKYRMAFILMDLVIQNWSHEPKCERNEQQNKTSNMESFFIKFLKLHAVMQPVALGKSADLFIYANQELARRKEMKTLQIRKLTQDTKRILRSLDVEVPKYKDKGRSFFEDKLLSVQINKLAIAIPLERHEDTAATASVTSTPLSKPRSKPKHHTAFLFSVRFIDLSTKKLEKSHGLVNDLCLQFIPHFDENNEKFFSQVQHTKMNRVFLPVIECNVFSHVTTTKHKVQIDAHVEGFEVDIEPTVVEHVNNLDDIWQNNKLRFSSLTNENATSNSQQRSDHSVDLPKDVDESSTLHMVSLEVETSFAFSSGTCRFYPKMSKSIVPNHLPTKHATDNGTPIDLGVGVFVVPGLNLQLVFVTPIGEYARSVIDPSARRIYLEIMIHPSENVIYPSVIPFIKDILLGLKLGVQRSSEKKHVTKVENPSSAIQEFSVSLYLRLSQTRFDLSCQPASKVALSLLWKEGNFLMSSGNENGYHGITCTGNIKGASVVVQHAFSPEHCLLGETRNALFNMTIMSRNDSIAKENSVSAVAQISEIRGDFNMRHFQDFLLFKNVWLDRSIDQFTTKDQTQDLSSSEEIHSTIEADSSEDTEHPKPFSLFLIISLKHIDIAGDLGQAIGKVYFSTENITFKTTLVPDTFRSLTSTIGRIELKSEGRLKGSATLDGLQVVLNAKNLPAVIENSAVHNWVNVQLALGHIATTFEYEYQRILVAEIDPILLDLKDQWNSVNPEEMKVNIHMSVALKEAEIISSIKTHPVLIGIGNKLVLLIEEKRRLAFDSMASTYFVESNSNTNTHPPVKPPIRTTNPMQTHILIGNKSISPTGEISLTLERARITIYPNRFSDNVFIQGRLEGLNIELKRSVTLDEKINRSLILQFATVMISKNRCKKLELQDENRLSIGEWIHHISESSSKNVLYLPSTRMEMSTEQLFRSNVIEHQFSTEFVGRVDIALDFTLYKYLMELVSLYNQLRSSSRQEKEKSHSSDTQRQRGAIAEAGHRADTATGPSDKATAQETTAPKKLIYKAVEPIRLNPQLKLMGDATPPLEWIGVQRQKVPEAIHDHVTSNLEDFLLVVQDLYVEQISKGAH